MNIQRFVMRAFGALVLLAACAQPAAAQWPTVVMFHGGTLKQPVLATGGDTTEFSRFVGTATASSAVTAKDMGDRPYANVAFFWGTRDNPASNGTPPAGLKPEMTWHHGRFYPAAAGKPAMMFMVGMALNKNDMLTSVQVKQRFMSSGTPVPADPAVFNYGGQGPASTLAVLKRLGIATEAGR
jgi:hypothetical protein